MSTIKKELFQEKKYHSIMHFVIFQMRLHSHSVRPDLRLFVMRLQILCEGRVNAVVRLHECAGSSEPSLFAYVMSTLFKWAVSNLKN